MRPPSPRIAGVNAAMLHFRQAKLNKRGAYINATLLPQMKLQPALPPLQRTEHWMLPA